MQRGRHVFGFCNISGYVDIFMNQMYAMARNVDTFLMHCISTPWLC